MKHRTYDPFAGDTLSDDEFDQLFSELLQVEPPCSLIDNILYCVSQLPHPTREQEQAPSEDSQEGPTISYCHLQPS